MSSTFHCDELHLIDSKNEIIDCHVNRLNCISEDIKALEKKLKSAAIPFEFVFVVFSESSEKGMPDDPSNTLFEETTIKHCLVWGEAEPSSFRLSYKLYESVQLFNCGNEFSFKELLKFSVPLIEAKAHLRLKFSSALPEFYQALLDNLKEIQDFPAMIVHYGKNCKNIPETLRTFVED